MLSLLVDQHASFRSVDLEKAGIFRFVFKVELYHTGNASIQSPR